MIQGIVFDCDGTLADTMPIHWRAWEWTARKYDLRFTEERFYALGGVPAPDIVALLAKEQGLKLDAVAIGHEKEEEYLRRLQTVEPIPEVVNVAWEHRGRIPMAVASGGTLPIIDMVLRRLGIRELFQAVVTSEQVTRQKPAPDIYLEAARRIGISPQHCRGYEDTDLGIEAVRAAGMEAIDVRNLRKPASSTSL
ncbi:MAG: HAD family phosphatase [Verrucomicrobia bacterium]|nr:HAD family phosphatase [Verrucomicrobiota bacterium]